MENKLALPETFKPEIFKKLIDQAPEIYSDSQIKVSKAIEIGEKYIKLAEAEKSRIGRITDETDAKFNNYLINSKNAKKNINDRRSPVTKIFQDVIKLFTSLENTVDVTKQDTYAFKIQELRNELATIKAEEQRKKELELQRQKKVEEERITIRSTIEKYIKEKYFEYLTSIKTKLYELFNGLTLDNWNINIEVLKNWDNKYPENHYLTLKPPVTKIYLTDDDVAIILNEYRDIKMYAEFSGDFAKKIDAVKEDLLEKLPGKKKELEALKQADDLEAEKLREQKAKREAEEAEKLRLEQEKELENIAKESEANAEVNKANTLFEMEAQNADIVNDVNIKKLYKIEIINSAGYLPIISFYFQKEGNGKTVDVLSKKTLGSMVTFAEKYFDKHDEKVNSPHVIYKEVVKAVNK